MRDCYICGLQSSSVWKVKHLHTDQNNILSVPMDSANHFWGVISSMPVFSFACSITCINLFGANEMTRFCSSQICYLYHVNVTCSLRRYILLCSYLHPVTVMTCIKYVIISYSFVRNQNVSVPDMSVCPDFVAFAMRCSVHIFRLRRYNKFVRSCLWIHSFHIQIVKVKLSP